MADKLPQAIYGDESGFTGNNLLNKTQPFFSYATVAGEKEEFKDFVSKIIADYNVQGGELKSSKLLKYNKGRKAITEILKKFSNDALVSIFHKKYSLASKFFEYIFEPPLAEKNSLFYRINFHRFIANILYVWFSANVAYAEDIFEEFESAMRSLDDKEFNVLTTDIALPDVDPIIEEIRTFAKLNKPIIKEELESLKNIGSAKWILELSDTALFHQLAEWGQKFEQIEVFCDASKPIDSMKEVLNVMIDRKDKKFIDAFGYP